jgi:hypothetical protein
VVFYIVIRGVSQLSTLQWFKNWVLNIIYYLLLLREAKALDPFLPKLRGRRSVKFSTVIHYKED